MNINQQISYRYPYAWNEMGGEPKVNRLLKALIEGNLAEANRLVNAGATLKAIDKTTFQHALFHILENYNTVKFMTDHGLKHIFFNYLQCIDGRGLSWGLTGRAFKLLDKKLLELLFSKGFEPSTFWEGNRYYQLDQYAMKNGIISLIDLMLCHGYPKEKLLNCLPYDERMASKACRYVENKIILNWKSYGLGNLEKRIPEPKLSKFLFISTRKQKEQYELRMQSYQMEKKIKQKWIDSLTEEEKKAIAYNKEMEDITVEAMMDVIKDNPEMFEQKQKPVWQEENEFSFERRASNNRNENSSESEADHQKSFLNSEMRDMERRAFVYIDGKGTYRHWGEDFVDCKGNWCNWGTGFYDHDGNYIRWGNTYKDSSGAYRRWGDDFVDESGNWVKCPRD